MTTIPDALFADSASRWNQWLAKSPPREKVTIGAFAIPPCEIAFTIDGDCELRDPQGNIIAVGKINMINGQGRLRSAVEEKS